MTFTWQKFITQQICLKVKYQRINLQKSGVMEILG